jgi:hypothetical protein
MVYFGVFVFNMWIVPFWFWGIYRLDIGVPQGLEAVFYWMWHRTILLVIVSSTLAFCFLIISMFIRRDPLKELGIRTDNLSQSGRECVLVSTASIFLMILVFLFYYDTFTPHSFASYVGGFVSYPIWGIIQQFLLLSIILFRLIQITRNNIVSLIFATVLFSLIHAPNVSLMIATFFFGMISCVLFLRNRNIFTIGIMHGVLAVFFSSLLVPGLVANYKTGPWRGNTEFVAELKYTGGQITVKEQQRIEIPVLVVNKSTATWDSGDAERPVHISYHLLDSKGNMSEFENPRTLLETALRTGDSETVDLSAVAPSKPGKYYLEVDVVKEKVAWFKDRGSKTIRVPLVVR